MQKYYIRRSETVFYDLLIEAICVTEAESKALEINLGDLKVSAWGDGDLVSIIKLEDCTEME
jgi:hypothetical protein